MKRLMRIHLYLSCFVAPVMLFFAVSGAWQAFRFQETKKDGSYRAPAALSLLSDIHKAEHLSGASGNLLRGGQVAIAAAFVATAIVGLVMAFRVARHGWLLWACLAAGVVIPLLLVVAARAG
jgi:hypothetical protein